MTDFEPIMHRPRSALSTRTASSADASATSSTGAPKTWGEWEREQQKPDGDR